MKLGKYLGRRLRCLSEHRLFARLSQPIASGASSGRPICRIVNGAAKRGDLREGFGCSNYHGCVEGRKLSIGFWAAHCIGMAVALAIGQSSIARFKLIHPILAFAFLCRLDRCGVFQTIRTRLGLQHRSGYRKPTMAKRGLNVAERETPSQSPPQTETTPL